MGRKEYHANGLLQVLIGFMGTAILVLLITIVCYICDCIPKPVDGTEHSALNQVDQRFLDSIWRRGRPQLSDKIKKVLEDGVRSFSDLQIIAGIAILSAGYLQLHCSVSSFHWQILVYAAWFSSVTHLTTLTVLQHYFQKKNSIIQRVRCFLMFCIIIMLTIALLPTGHKSWLLGYSDAGVPAMCYLQDLSGLNISSGHTDYMIVSVLVLLVSYFNKVLRLYSTSSELTRKYLRSKPGNFLKRLIRSVENSRLWIPVYVVLSVQLVILRAAFDFFESMLWEVCGSPVILL